MWDIWLVLGVFIMVVRGIAVVVVVVDHLVVTVGRMEARVMGAVVGLGATGMGAEALGRT